MEKLEQVVTKAANGDKNAFEELYKNTYKKVYFTCMAFLKNDHDAADVSQDIYITVIKGLPELKDKSKFESWLGVITVNKCKDFLKKRKPVIFEEEDLAEQIPEDNELLLPEEYVTNKAKRKILMDIIKENLSDTLYQTVVMFYFQNMSAAEIAELMECPVGTITSRLCLARAKIKDAILEYEKKSGDKLHSVALVPILALLFKEEANAMEPAYMCESIMKAASTKAATAKVAVNAGGKTMLKSLQAKLIAGLAAVVVIGGIATVVTKIGNKDNPSQEEYYESVENDYSEEVSDYGDYSETYDYYEDTYFEEETVDDYEAKRAEYMATAESIVSQVGAFFDALKAGDTATLKTFASDLDSVEYYEDFIELCDVGATSGFLATIYKDLEYYMDEETLEELVDKLEWAYEDGDETVRVEVAYSVPELLSLDYMYISSLDEGTVVSHSVADVAQAHEMLQAALNKAPMIAEFDIWVSMPDENGNIKVDIDEIMEHLKYPYWGFTVDDYLVMNFVEDEVLPGGHYADGTFLVGRDASLTYEDKQTFVTEADKYLSQKDFVGYGKYLSTVSGRDYVTEYNDSWGNYDDLTDTQKQFVDNFVAEKMNYQFIEYSYGKLSGMMIVTMPILDDGYQNLSTAFMDWSVENDVMETHIAYATYPDYTMYSDILYSYYRVINYARNCVE